MGRMWRMLAVVGVVACGSSEPQQPVSTITIALSAGSDVGAVLPSPRTAGMAVQLYATLRDAHGTLLTNRPVTWTSGDLAAATVSQSGLLTIVNPARSGSVAAAAEGKEALLVFIVDPPTPVTVVVTPSNATLNVGQAIQLAVSVTAPTGTAKTVTWSSSNSAVVTVDQTGKATAIGKGVATVVATSTADASKASASAITVQ